MTNHPITAEQAKQADELGYFLVKVEPEIFKDNGYRFVAKPKYFMSLGWLINNHSPFTLNDEVYCEDERQMWVGIGKCSKPEDAICLANDGKYILYSFPENSYEQPASTMPASLASKKWTVTGIEVVEDYIEDVSRVADYEGMYDKQWHWKIITQENTNAK